jgi:hypothetical protein
MSIQDLTPDQRAQSIRHYIDHGFVNFRLVQTIVGEAGVTEINRRIALLPDEPDWLRRTKIGHVYTRVALTFCEVIGVPSLGEILARGQGRIFCSTEQLGPVDDVYGAKRLTVPITIPGDIAYRVTLELGTQHISSDTLRSELDRGSSLSVIAAMPTLRDGVLSFRPLVIGSPWLETDDPEWTDQIVWWGHEYFENFVGDFDEFSKVNNEPMPSQEQALIMKRITESAFKTCIAEILGDYPKPDWGGETSDHYSAHLHLCGRPTTGAFLLKGPARFAPMTLNHLGKNNDQIYRLAQEPAEVLFVQHCHEVLPPVRATLRAFAVQPSRPRRFCVIDGRESLRLLLAYGLLDRAVALSDAS